MENFISCMKKFVINEIGLLYSNFICCRKKSCKNPCSCQIFKHIKFHVRQKKLVKSVRKLAKTCKTSMQARLGLPLKVDMIWLYDAMQFILWPYNRSLVNLNGALYDLHVIRLQDSVRPSCFFSSRGQPERSQYELVWLIDQPRPIYCQGHVSLHLEKVSITGMFVSADLLSKEILRK